MCPCMFYARSFTSKKEEEKTTPQNSRPKLVSDGVCYLEQYNHEVV